MWKAKKNEKIWKMAEGLEKSLDALYSRKVASTYIHHRSQHEHNLQKQVRQLVEEYKDDKMFLHQPGCNHKAYPSYKRRPCNYTDLQAKLSTAWQGTHKAWYIFKLTTIQSTCWQAIEIYSLAIHDITLSDNEYTLMCQDIIKLITQVMALHLP